LKVGHENAPREEKTRRISKKKTLSLEAEKEMILKEHRPRNRTKRARGLRGRKMALGGWGGGKKGGLSRSDTGGRVPGVKRRRSLGGVWDG